MKTLLNASYAVNFDDYETLAQMTLPGTGVELCLFSDKPEYMQALRAQKARFSGMPVTLHGPFREVDAANPHGSEKHRQIIAAYEDALDVYDLFGAHSMVMHTHSGSRPVADKQARQQQSLSTILEIGEMARARGAQLTVENVGFCFKDTVLFDEDEFIELILGLPGHIGCLIDTGHMIVNRWDACRVVKALGSRIWSYHIHNNDGTRDGHRPPYEPGLLYTPAQIDELFACMEQYSPQADWVLEYEPGPHISIESVKGDLQRMLKIAGRA